MYPENLLTTSGLKNLMHGVILLSDAMSHDKAIFINFIISFQSVWA